MAKSWSVYKITANDGRAYIGLTGKTVSWRWSKHKSHARRGDMGVFLDAIRKYGEKNFSIETLVDGLTKTQAILKEVELISSHNTLVSNGMGFNKSPGGGAPGEFTAETRKRISDRMRALYADNTGLFKEWHKSRLGVPLDLSDEERARRSAHGKIFILATQTPEVNAKKSLSSKERSKAPDHQVKLRRNIKAARAGITEESLKRMAETKRAQNADPTIGAQIRHRFWATNEYNKALAARIGYERSWRLFRTANKAA